MKWCDFVGCLVPPLEWDELFKVRGVDYRGEEALPKEVGNVPLRDVCTLGSKHYVDFFQLYLKPESEWGPIPKPRVMVRDEDWPSVCKGLVESGVCVFIDEDDVFCAPQGPLLNGMFGVTKEEFTDSGTEIYRLIMNLIPLNRLCRPMVGDVDTLPSRT